MFEHLFTADFKIPHCFTLTTIGCGGRLTAPPGAFTSPNYPDNYPHASNCRWEIQIPTGRILLTFLTFELGDCAESDVKVMPLKVLTTSRPNAYRAFFSIKLATKHNIYGKYRIFFKTYTYNLVPFNNLRLLFARFSEKKP